MRVEVIDAALGARTLLADHVVTQLAHSGDGRLIAVAGASGVRLWRLDQPPATVTTATVAARPPGAPASPGVMVTPELAASADGTTLVIDWLTGPVELWRRDGARLERIRELPVDAGADLAMSPDGTLLLYVGDDGAMLLPLAGGEATPLGDAVLGWFARDGTAHTP